MRLLIASVAALVAVAFAAPSFAQDESPAAAPVPTTKPKPGTSAYCQTLKSASSRSACLKKITVAKAQPAQPKTTTKSKAKKSTTTAAPKQPDSAQLPPAAAPAPAPAAMPTGNVAVPPLPSKTI